jgi:lambda family phage minor tail protein L
MPTYPDQRARSLEPGELIVLYELDLTAKISKYTGAPGTIFYFHDGIQQGTNLISFKGHTYSPFPIKAEGFEWNTRGVLPRPKLTVSNIGSVVSALCLEFDDLIGATLVQRRTFSAFIGGGSEPDNTKEFTPQIFVIDRKASETNTSVSFELATGMDAEGVLLPRRQVLATACPFLYRGTECGYPAPSAGGSGWPVFNRLGAVFPGGHFTDGAVPAGQNKLKLTSATAVFHTSPSQLSDVGKVIKGSNFVAGTLVAAVDSATQITLSYPAIAENPTPNLVFDIVRTNGRTSGGSTSTLPLAWDAATTYSANDTAYVIVNGLRIYAVSKVGSNLNHPVYDENYWYLDVCLKKQSDCEYHFGQANPLPYG